jgi:hypothetical protein
MFENIRNFIKANLENIDWNIVKPFPLRNCIYNKIIEAKYTHKDFDKLEFNDLIKIKGIGKVKAKEFLLERDNYKT